MKKLREILYVFLFCVPFAIVVYIVAHIGVLIYIIYKMTNPNNIEVKDFIELSPSAEHQQQMYSEEDMREAFENGVGSGKYQAEYGDNAKGSMNFEYFIEQFKKK